MSRWDREDLEQIRVELRGLAARAAGKPWDATDAECGRLYHAMVKAVVTAGIRARRLWNSDLVDHAGDYEPFKAEVALRRYQIDHPQEYAAALRTAFESLTATSTSAKGGDR